VSVDVTNTGRRAGDEVVQLYARHIGSRVARPNEDLRGYKRITLSPGETRTVAFRVASSALAYWDSTRHAWTVETDSVQLRVGASSADIRRSKTIAVDGGTRSALRDVRDTRQAPR
jgi:beta-glucosidase